MPVYRLPGQTKTRNGASNNILWMFQDGINYKPPYFFTFFCRAHALQTPRLVLSTPTMHIVNIWVTSVNT
jgi:hypothetical protein